MSPGKSAAKLVAATLFTTFLSLLILLAPLQEFTGYEYLKAIARGEFKSQEPQINLFIEQSCMRSQSFEIPVGNEKLSFRCSEIHSSNELFGRIFDANYNKKYDCPIQDCIKQPAVFASAFGNRLVKDAVTMSAVITLLSLVALAFVTEQKIKGIGISLLFVGMNYFLLGITKNSVAGVIAGVPAVDALFGQMMSNFLLVLVAGIILTAVGFAAKK